MRQLLLKQYIGAIVAAFMLVDGISSMISAVASAGYTAYLRTRVGYFPEAMADQVEKSLSYGSLIATVIRGALFFAVFFLLVRWLYPDIAFQERRAAPAEEAQ